MGIWDVFTPLYLIYPTVVMTERRNTNSLLKLWQHLDSIFTSQGRDNTVRLIELCHTTDMHLHFSAMPKSLEGQSLSCLLLEEINLPLSKRLNLYGLQVSSKIEAAIETVRQQSSKFYKIEKKGWSCCAFDSLQSKWSLFTVTLWWKISSRLLINVI